MKDIEDGELIEEFEDLMERVELNTSTYQKDAWAERLRREARRIEL